MHKMEKLKQYRSTIIVALIIIAVVGGAYFVYDDIPHELREKMPLIFGAGCLVVAIYILIYVHCIHKDWVRKEIKEQLYNKNNSQKDNQANSQNSAPDSQYQQHQTTKAKQQIDDLESRVRNLEIELLQRKQVAPMTPQHNPVARPVFVPKTLYSGINSDEYFTNVAERESETCFFKITQKSEREGQFDIISLHKIQSGNGWEKVVEFEGNCELSAAKNYRAIRQGKCELQSPGEWKIVEKLKIKISK